MGTIHITVPEDLDKRMYRQIQELSPGNTYGKARVFTIFALEKLVEALEKGDKALNEELRKRFEKIRKS